MTEGNQKTNESLDSRSAQDTTDRDSLLNPIFKCSICEKEFKPNRQQLIGLKKGKRIYCSEQCGILGNRLRARERTNSQPKIERICQFCENPFFYRPNGKFPLFCVDCRQKVLGIERRIKNSYPFERAFIELEKFKKEGKNYRFTDLPNAETLNIFYGLRNSKT